MKRLVLLFLSCSSLSLGACVVPLDGAPCDTSENCPRGQACVERVCVEGATPTDPDAGRSGADASVPTDASAPGPDACTDDPACVQEGAVCDPARTNKLGTCRRVEGCLRLEDLTDCGSAEVCKPGESACSCKTCEVGELACNGDKTEVRQCAGEAGAKCGEFTRKKETCEGGLVCAKSGKSVDCVCPVPGEQLIVDVAADNGALEPTGATSPPACRFKTITAALEVASSGKKVVLVGATELHPVWAPNSPYKAGDLVISNVPVGAFFRATTDGISGATEPNWPLAMGGSEVTDGTVKWVEEGEQVTPDFTSEPLPLVVPEGVALTTEQCLGNPSDPKCTARGYRILGSGNAVVVRLGRNASLEGLSVSSSDGSAPALVTCAAEGAVLRRVALWTLAPTAVGLKAETGCDLAATETRFSGFASAGLSVQGGKVSLSGVTFEKNEVAVQVAGGSVHAVGTTMTGGAAGKAAVDVGPGTVTGDKLEVRSGAGVGLRVSAGTVTLTNSVFSNQGEEGVVVSGGVVTLEGAKVQGNPRGVRVSGGSCTLDKQCVVSTNMQAGVQVSGGVLAVTDSELKDNNHGLEQSGGTTTVTRGAIRLNARNGVSLSTGTLQMASSEVVGNGMSGIEAKGSSSVLRLEATKVRNNAAPSVPDPVAGLVLENNVQVESISGCQFLGNYPAQIRVKTSSPWTLDLSAPGCPSQNVVGCYPSAATGVQVVGEVTLKISNTAWPTNPPNVPIDYPAANVTVAPTCPGPPVCN